MASKSDAQVLAWAQKVYGKYDGPMSNLLGLPDPGVTFVIDRSINYPAETVGSVIHINPDRVPIGWPPGMIVHEMTHAFERDPNYKGHGNTEGYDEAFADYVRYKLTGGGAQGEPGWTMSTHANRFANMTPAEITAAASSMHYGTFTMPMMTHPTEIPGVGNTLGTPTSTPTPGPAPDSGTGGGGTGGGNSTGTDAPAPGTLTPDQNTQAGIIASQLYTQSITWDQLTPEAQGWVTTFLQKAWPNWVNLNVAHPDPTVIEKAVAQYGNSPAVGWSTNPPPPLATSQINPSVFNTTATGPVVTKITAGNLNTTTGASRATFSTVLDKLQMPIDNAMHDLITKALAQGWSTNQFLQAVRRSSEYAKNFPGIIGPNGAPIMSEARYNDYVRQYQQIGNQYGQTVTRNEIGHDLANNVSAAELTNRLQAEQSLSMNKVYFDQFNKTLAAMGMKPLDAAGQRSFVMGAASADYYKVWNEAATRAAAANAGIAIGPHAATGGLGDQALTRGEIRYGEKASLAATGKLPTQAQYADLASKLKLLPQSRLFGGGLNRQAINEIEFGGPHQAAYIDKANQLLANEQARAQGTGEITQSQTAIGQRQAGVAEGF